MTDQAPEHDDDMDECVPISAFLEMSARMTGRIQALEAALMAVLSRRDDLEALERHVDAILVNTEASKISDNKMPEEAMRAHEWADQSARALFVNTRTARKLR